MTARRPIVLVLGSPDELWELIDGDAALCERLADRNAVEWLKAALVASAVNGIEIAPATAADPHVEIRGVGSSTDVWLRLKPKGAGAAEVGTDTIATLLAAQLLKQKDLLHATNRLSNALNLGGHRQWVKNPGAATWTALGFAATPTIDGSSSSSDDTNTGAFCKVTTAGALNDFAGIRSPFTLTRVGRFPHFAARVKMPATLTALRFWAGITAGVLHDNTDADNEATHHAAFRFDTAIDATFKMHTADGTSSDAANTGVTPAAGQEYLFEIHFENATTARFLIDGADKGGITIALPAAGDDLGIEICVAALAAAAKDLSIGHVSLSSR